MGTTGSHGMEAAWIPRLVGRWIQHLVSWGRLSRPALWRFTRHPVSLRSSALHPSPCLSSLFGASPVTLSLFALRRFTRHPVSLRSSALHPAVPRHPVGFTQRAPSPCLLPSDAAGGARSRRQTGSTTWSAFRAPSACTCRPSPRRASFFPPPTSPSPPTEDRCPWRTREGGTPEQRTATDGRNGRHSHLFNSWNSGQPPTDGMDDTPIYSIRGTADSHRRTDTLREARRHQRQPRTDTPRVHDTHGYRGRPNSTVGDAAKLAVSSRINLVHTRAFLGRRHRRCARVPPLRTSGEAVSIRSS